MQTPLSSISSSDPGDSVSPLKKPLIAISFAIFVLSLVALSFGRLIRFESLCNRALECVILGKGGNQPFRSDAKYSYPQVCGDIPHLMNHPEHCVWREEIFFTDHRGYRNDPAVNLADYRSVVFGDSFAYGQGSSQDETPASMLSRALGEKVYDGAGKTELRFLRSTLDAAPGIGRVFYLHLERHPRSPAELEDFTRGFSAKELSPFRKWYQQLKIYNPVQILATRLDKWLRREGLFPNHYTEVAFEIETEHSGSQLFLRSTAHFVERDLERTESELAFFNGLKDLLQKRGVALTIVLIPEKYAVYQSTSRPLHLDEIDVKLREDGHEVVHLLPQFRPAVKLPRELDEPLYWRDDTHWSPRGIRMMADAVSSARLKPNP